MICSAELRRGQCAELIPPSRGIAPPGSWAHARSLRECVRYLSSSPPCVWLQLRPTKQWPWNHCLEAAPLSAPEMCRISRANRGTTENVPAIGKLSGHGNHRPKSTLAEDLPSRSCHAHPAQ